MITNSPQHVLFVSQETLVANVNKGESGVVFIHIAAAVNVLAGCTKLALNLCCLVLAWQSLSWLAYHVPFLFLVSTCAADLELIHVFINRPCL